MKKSIISTINFFYPPFRRIFSIQTFRYAVCGFSNTILGLCLFFTGYNHIFDKSNFDLGFFVFEPHSAALFFSSAVCFVVGFSLNKYIVFSNSHLRGRVQLFRYLLSFFFNMTVNYFVLKILVETWELPAMPSQIFTTIFIIALSYVSQKYFTFRTNP